MASIKYLAPDTDAYVDFIVGHCHEFTEATGLDVRTEILTSDEYFSNDIHVHLGGDDPADVYMSGPVLLWAHVGAGLVQPLDEHIAASTTEFDATDFFDPLLSSNRWTGRFGDRLGAGPLWEIPVNCESYNLAYVPSILDANDVDVPRTWTDYFAAADQLVQRSGGAVRGLGQRGTQVWHTMYTGYASQFWSWGATDFDESGRCAIASDAGVAATTAFVDALRRSGPTDLLDQRWYELALDFCAGRYGMIVDSDHYVAFYEDPAVSSIVGHVGYAPPLAGPTGAAMSNLWTWSLVMNARSPNQSNVWRFIEWAAGRDVLRRAAGEGNMNPTRASTWDDEEFRTRAAGWGDFYDVARRLVEHDARVLVTPHPNYLRLADRWVSALRSAFTGETGVGEALELAAADIDRLVTELG